jgi:UDP-N-acetylglucosamine 2-epimerase
MERQKNIELVTIAGTRPEIIKLADLIPKLNNIQNHAFVYTGQHYSKNMKDIFFDELNLIPNYDLKCNTSEVSILKNHIWKTLKFLNPSYVIVYGDTNSAMAGALAAKEIGCRLLHLEAGVRDFDLTVPEESIRIRIDGSSEYLFAPSKFCKTVLKYEDIIGKVFLTGNLIVDVCRRLSKVASDLKINHLKYYDDYLLLTLHRPENSDDPVKLKMLKKHLENVKYKIIFPIHPRTKKNLERFNIRLPQNVKLIEATGYLEFLQLLKNCRLVLTDSGGVQEEAIILRKPCITLRHTSARWETILLKANILFPLDRRDSLNDVVETMMTIQINRNPYGENVANLTAMKIDKIIKTCKNKGIRQIK